MDADRWARVEALFTAASELPPADREAFLRDRTADDSLRDDVRSLLAHLGGADAAPAADFEQAVGGAARAWADETPRLTASRLVGTRLGAYEITAIAGQGGMGAVYRARRADGEFEQTVAIKVVRQGLDSPAALERFRRERQILARLQHPHIARLVDGGTVADDAGHEQPYVVMEFVDGQPITEYCESRDLSVADRLQLFLRVCGAVQYAHQQLVVHRDLKPSNILVTAEGHPKLLDFGVAKLLEADADAPPLTRTAAPLLTPEYAAPEQIRAEPITAATDVYALGAVLYELVTGRKAQHFDTLSTSELLRVVCDVDPPKPSAALAARPPATAGKLRRQIRGDLDTIVLKALRKEPPRRYASVEAFAEDVRRYLDGWPIQARADTFSYRAATFVRRNRIVVSAAALVVASLVIGLLAATRAARARAVEAARAERRFQDVRALAGKMLFDFDRAIADVPGTVAARQLLVETATRYLDRLAAEAHDDRDLRFEVAVGYTKVGDVQGALGAANAGQSGSALDSYRKALAILEPLAAHGLDERLAMLTAQCHLRRGEILGVQGSRAAAFDEFRLALRDAEAGLARQPSSGDLAAVVLSTDNRWGDLLLQTGDVAAAAARFERSVAAWANQPAGGAFSMARTTTTARLAVARRELADLDGALALFRECERAAARELEARLRTGGSSTLLQSVVALLRTDIGITLAGGEGPNLGDTERGVALLRDAVRGVGALSDADPRNSNARRDLIDITASYGAAAADAEPATAAAALSRALADADALLRERPGDRDVRQLRARVRSALAPALSRAGRSSDGAAHAEAAAADLEALVDRDPENVELRDTLVLTRLRWAAADRDRAAAERQLQQAVAAADALVRATPDRPHARFLRATAQERLADRLGAGGGAEDARRLHDAARAEWTEWVRRGWAVSYARGRLRRLADGQ